MGQQVGQISRPMTVNDHIKELVKRLLISAIIMLAAGTVVFIFYKPVLAFLSSPLNSPLYYTNPAGSFNFIMKICLAGALIIAIPVLIFNLIMFVRPAFRRTLSLKRILTTTIASTLLAISGAAFAFYCILPGTLRFFNDFQVSGLKAMISADSYLGFITNLIIMFIIVFQVPLVMLFIDHIRPFKPKDLIKKGKWVVLISLVFTIIQPFAYDILTSLMIAMPIVVMYYLSVILVIAQHLKTGNELSVPNDSRAVVSKPTMEPEDKMALDGLVYSYLSDELIDLEKPKPVKPASTLPSGQSVMEFTKLSSKPEKIKPAAWVEERKARQEKFSRPVPVFSDIVKPGTNRALA